jgi:hypothetical protein
MKCSGLWLVVHLQFEFTIHEEAGPFALLSALVLVALVAKPYLYKLVRSSEKELAR